MTVICGLKAFLLKPTMTIVDRCDGRRLGSASSPAREKPVGTDPQHGESCVHYKSAPKPRLSLGNQ
jgi:hypothetical protein